jgi:hypothetical protein
VLCGAFSVQTASGSCCVRDAAVNLSRELVADAPGTDAHVHSCPRCESAWTHEGACQEGQFAWCDACVEFFGIGFALWRQGRHFHYCVECTRTWRHTLPCATPLRAVLSDCSRCRKQSAGTPRPRGVRTGVEGGSPRRSLQNGLGRAARTVAAQGARLVATIQSQLRRASSRTRGMVAHGRQAGASAVRHLGHAARTVAAQGARLVATIQSQLRRASPPTRGMVAHGRQAGASAVRHLGRAGRTVAAQGARLVATIRWHLLRNRMAAALTAFGSGMALVFIATGLLGRITAPPDPVLPIAGRSLADQGPHAVHAPQVSEPSHAEPRNNPRVETATPATAGLRANAKLQPTLTTPDRRMASGPTAAVQRPAVASPAVRIPPIEVVAVRFGVLDRTLPEWTWSWRITIYTPSDPAPVNARIEFVELHDSTRRLVAYKDLCDLRVGGGLAFIEGIHTLSAADSRRISTVTATVSAATDAAQLTTCRPRS